MNKWISLLYIIACLACTGCLNQPADEPIQADGGGSEVTNGRIYGTIFNPDSSPAAFATVTFVPVAYSPLTASGNAVQAPDSVVANARGQYRLDTLSRGFYNILSRGGGGMAYLDSVFIADDYDSRVDDTLEAPNAIHGVARLEAATDHSNIVILVLGTQTYATTNNARGEYVIPPLAPGKYRLRFLTTVPGYGYRDTLVNVSPGGAAAVIDTLVLPLVSPQQVKNVRLRYDKHLMAMQLTWPAINPSLIKGYNVYRAADLGEYEKQNHFPLADTVFVQNLLPFEGQTIHYGVNSVDLKGRESEHSPAVSILVEKAYKNDSTIHYPNLEAWDNSYDFDGDGNLYVFGRDQILRKFDKSGLLLLQAVLDGSGSPLLPKIRISNKLRYSASGFILLSESPDPSRDTVDFILHKFDYDFKYLGKLSLKFSRKWHTYDLSDNGDIYILHTEIGIMRMDFDGTVRADRVFPLDVYSRIQALGDTLYLTYKDTPYKEPNWLTLDRDLKDIALRKPGTWLNVNAGSDSDRVRGTRYYKCPNGQSLVYGYLKLDPPMTVAPYNKTMDELPFVSLFNSRDSLLSQFLIPASASYLKMGPGGDLIFRPQVRPDRLYRFRDTIPGSGIVWETVREDTGPHLPATDGKIGRITGHYDPKTMRLNLNWSLFDKRDGLGFHLYRETGGGQRELVVEAVMQDTSHRDQLVRFANQVLYYSVAWVDRDRNEVMLDKPLRIEVSSALKVGNVSLDLTSNSLGCDDMAVHPDGNLLFLDTASIIRCGPRGENCQTQLLNTSGFNFRSTKPLNLMTDEKGRIIAAIMGSDSVKFPPYNKARVLLYRFNRELALLDSLILDVGREESSTSFFCNSAGEIFHHATLWYKTRITIYDTSLAIRKTVEIPGIIHQIQAMRDTVYVYSTKGGDCDHCLMEYYDLDFNKLGQVNKGFYFDDSSSLNERRYFHNIYRLPEGRFIFTELDPLIRSQQEEPGKMAPPPRSVLYVIGRNDSLEARTPDPSGFMRLPLNSNRNSVYIWDCTSMLYIVDIGALETVENGKTAK